MRTCAISPDAVLPQTSETSSAERCSIGISFRPSWTVQSMVGDGSADIEGHAVVVRRERLEIGADLVADVAIGGGAVGADDHHVDLAALHQMAAGIVDDQRVRHAVAGHLPGGELGTLVARPRLVDIDVDRNAGFRRQIDRRGRGAVVDGRQPAGVAVGQDVDRLARLLASPRSR